MDRQGSARRRAVRPLEAEPRPAPALGAPSPPPGAERAIRDCAVYCPDGRHPGRLPIESAVGTAVDLGGFVWVGVHEPTEQEFADVAAAFSLPALAVEDAVRAHQRPKLEIYDGVVFMVLKPVRYVDSAEVIETAEIAVFVGERFVVTVRHGDSDVLSAVRADLDAAQSRSPLLAHGPAGVLYAAADRVVDAYERGACVVIASAGSAWTCSRHQGLTLRRPASTSLRNVGQSSHAWSATSSGSGSSASGV